MDAWRGKDASTLQDGEAQGGISAAASAARRDDCNAAFPPDAVNRSKMPQLRVPDDQVSWRIVYRVDDDAIVIAEVFSKKTGKTPKRVVEICKARFREYDHG